MPFLNWRSQISTNSLKADAFAGFTNAAIVLPQGVAFATIAGLPPQYGLYTAMITPVVAALFGSSTVMVSGPTTAISAIVLTTLQGHAIPGTQQFIELVLLLTVMVGVFQFAAGLARLGGLVSFVSHSVMTGFTAAAAVLIGISQLSGAMGLTVERGGNVFERFLNVVAVIEGINWTAFAIAMTTFATVVLFHTFTKRLPGFLIALAAGGLLAWLIDAESKGVSMIGALPSALPTFAPPSFSISQIVELTQGAAAIAFVGLLEAVSIGRSFAIRRHERFDSNQEMIGQGLSNMVGGFFQAYAGSGSFTRSGVNAEAGARTPISAIFSSLFLIVILVLVAPLVAFIPTPAMAGLILYVAYKLINFREFYHVLESSKSETFVLVSTFIAGVAIELDFAIYVGVIASLSVFLNKSAHPALRVSTPTVSRSGRRKFRNADMHNLPECPQILSVRLDGPLYFGSVEHVEREFRKIERRRYDQKHVVLYLKGVGDVDLAGADLLIEEIREIKKRGGSFEIVALYPPLLRRLRRFHVIDEIGEDNLHISKGDAIAAAIKRIDLEICRKCRARVFLECAELPGAEEAAAEKAAEAAAEAERMAEETDGA
ncbi:MAG TPA: SulP family inorganic anion transporter [Afifellaceae bacterium]|nr:SulP family inorganic anion transporter [Afifellaceae bacterium]